MKKKTVENLAVDVGYSVSFNGNHVYLEKDNETVRKTGLLKAYQFLYQKKRKES